MQDYRRMGTRQGKAGVGQVMPCGKTVLETVRRLSTSRGSYRRPTLGNSVCTMIGTVTKYRQVAARPCSFILLYLHTVFYKVAYGKLIVQLARRVSVLRRPLHAKIALLFCNATGLLDHLAAIPISAERRVDEEVYVKG